MDRARVFARGLASALGMTQPKTKNANKQTKQQKNKPRDRDIPLPHENPSFLRQLRGRGSGSAKTPELQALREYTLSNLDDEAFDAVKLSTLYAQAGMLKYASTTLDRSYKDGRSPPPTGSDWMELFEAGRRKHDPAFVADMMATMRRRTGWKPSKKMSMVLLNAYAESALAEDAMEVYREMAKREGGPDPSMKMALLKATIRQREAPKAFVDEVVELLKSDLEGEKSLPRRVESMILMAYAAREHDNTVARCMELLEGLRPLRARDLLAMLRACRQAKDVAQGDRVLGMIEAIEGSKGDDVSLGTEVIRFQFVAGRVQEAVKTFNSIPWHARDLALVNVVLDALVANDPELGRQVFVEAWQRGFWGLRQRKMSRNGAIAHVDLHRMGIAAAELAIDQHLEELRAQDGPVKVVRLLVGKSGARNNPNKLRLADHVRRVLYERGIAFKEEESSVFTFSL